MFQPSKGAGHAKYCALCKKDGYYLGIVKKDPERRERHRAKTNKFRKETRKWLADYKLEKGCADCGYNLHFSALQLDHEGKKTVEISSARSSIKRLIKEIKDGQCVVRCANCHSIKTWEQKQNGRPSSTEDLPEVASSY